MDLRAFYVDAINKSLAAGPEEALLEGFDEERKADTRPHRRAEVYGFAYGVFRQFPGNPVYGDETVWDVVQRMFDRMCEWATEDGRWTWYVQATKKSYVMPRGFGFFEWLRTFEDFGEFMSAERRDRVEQMLRASLAERMRQAVPALADLSNRNTSLNILAHLMLQLWHGGRLFGEARWLDAGGTLMERIAACQTADGYWIDSRTPRGPVNAYSTVTLAAISHYAHHSGSAAALAAVAKAADYHYHLTYPDGTLVETPDERNRYRGASVNKNLLASFALFAETRSIAAYFAERMLALAESAETPPERPGLLAELCETLDAVPEGDVPVPNTWQGTAAFPTIPALSMRRGPWYACLSAATTEQAGGMFHHDLQNHLSVWHDGAGLIIGGGNSYQDPPFSTFRFGSCYLADSGRVREEDGTYVLDLSYGSIKALAQISIIDDTTLRIRAQASGALPPEAEFALHLTGRCDDTLCGSREDIPLEDRSIYRGECGELGPFTVGPLRFESDTMWMVQWPFKPVNIYNLPMRLPFDAAVMRLSAPLHDGPVEIRIAIRG